MVFLLFTISFCLFSRIMNCNLNMDIYDKAHDAICKRINAKCLICEKPFNFIYAVFSDYSITTLVAPAKCDMILLKSKTYLHNKHQILDFLLDICKAGNIKLYAKNGVVVYENETLESLLIEYDLNHIA